MTFEQGLSVGAIWTIYETARQLGIVAALGSRRQGKLALWQTIARVIDQGSRLSAVRLAGDHAACDILNLGAFDEDDLYENLDWLCTNQAAIEDRLAGTNKQGIEPARKGKAASRADSVFVYRTSGTASVLSLCDSARAEARGSACDFENRSKGQLFLYDVTSFYAGGGMQRTGGLWI